MPINTRHPSYEGWVEQAALMRACIAGEHQVRQMGTSLLPALSGASREDYLAYQARAQYFNATRRTLSAVHGNVFRRGTDVTLPSDMLDWATSVTLDGLDLDDFIQSVAHEVLSVGRCGVLVDWDSIANKPVFALYAGENIINWFDDMNSNGAKPIRLVLRESVDQPDGRDPFLHKTIDQLRDISVVDGFVLSETYQAAGNRYKKMPELTAQPVVRGRPLTQIPWVWFSSGHNNSHPSDSLLYDLAMLNVKHYMCSADLAHALHFTALPTPWITGLERGLSGDEQQQTWRIGSPVAWSLPMDCKVGMLEYTGAGVGSLRDDLRDKEARMAVLGAKLVGTLPATNSTATEWTFLNAAEQGALTGFINSIESGMESLLWWAGMMLNSTFDTPIAVKIPRDTNAQPITPEQLGQLYDVLQRGGINMDTYLSMLDRGELLPPNFDYMAERERLTGLVGNQADVGVARNQLQTIQQTNDNPMR